MSGTVTQNNHQRERTSQRQKEVRWIVLEKVTHNMEERKAGFRKSTHKSWGMEGSRVEHMFSMWETLHSIPGIKTKQGKKHKNWIPMWIAIYIKNAEANAIKATGKKHRKISLWPQHKGRTLRPNFKSTTRTHGWMQLRVTINRVNGSGGAGDALVSIKHRIHAQDGMEWETWR